MTNLTLDQQFDLALKVATEAHKDQRRWNGDPYIVHPLRVALRCESLQQKIVGLLHDVVEDTPYTFEQLLGLGFFQSIVDGVDSVTRRELENGDMETYEDFVLRSKINDLGRVVKLADLADNSSDLNPTSPRAIRYHKAIKTLEEV